MVFHLQSQRHVLYFNYLWICLLFVFGCFIFLGCFDYLKKSKNNENFQKDNFFFVLFLFCFFFCFLFFFFLEDYVNYNISLLT